MPRVDKTKGQDLRGKEIRLIELIRENPELYDSRHPRSRDNNQKRIVWQYISEELNAPVVTLKKLWRKMRYNYTKKCGKLEADIMAKSTPCDEALTFLMTSVMEYANENNCGNISSASPRGEVGAGSPSNLTAISEEERSTTTLVPLEDLLDSRDGGSPGPGIQPRENLGVKKTSDRVLRPRHSEPVRLTSRDSATRYAVADATEPRRLTMTPSSPNARSRNRKFVLDPRNSTMSFFNSMAITVASFPQHLQAIVKLEICKIVAQKECELSSLKNDPMNE